MSFTTNPELEQAHGIEAMDMNPSLSSFVSAVRNNIKDVAKYEIWDSNVSTKNLESERVRVLDYLEKTFSLNQTVSDKQSKDALRYLDNELRTPINDKIDFIKKLLAETPPSFQNNFPVKWRANAIEASHKALISGLNESLKGNMRTNKDILAMVNNIFDYFIKNKEEFATLGTLEKNAKLFIQQDNATQVASLINSINAA